MPTDGPSQSTTRAGYVALVGRPNAGKSTLLNRFVGEHLSIVTSKAQTTWQRVTGIRTKGTDQLIFLDTPGLLETRDLLQHAMLGAALEALAEADVALLVVDTTKRPTQTDTDRILAAFSEIHRPLHIVLNKLDQANLSSIEAWKSWAEEGLSGQVHSVSAKTGKGVDSLLNVICEDLPEGPFLYPEDDIASDPVRFFVAEFVREAIFEQFHQEIPYAVFCQVAEFREKQDPTYIHVDIFVERKSQKRIVVGNQGSAIKKLGSAARSKIERFLGCHVYLDLWVKPLPSWRKSPDHLSRLGFRVPAEGDPHQH